MIMEQSLSLSLSRKIQNNPHTNISDDANTVLRYAAFALVTVAQVRDKFWMEQSQWSMLVISVYALLPLLKFVSQNRIPNYHRQRTKKGLSFALLAALFFVMGLDEKNDRFRICHSVAHVFMGGALYQLWAIVPSSKRRRTKRGGGVIRTRSYDGEIFEFDGGWA